MRRLIQWIVVLCIIFTMIACGKTDVETEAGSTAAPMTWQEQYDLGIRLLNEGNYEEAILAFTAAISIDPKNTDAYIGLAQAYVETGKDRKAMEVLGNGLSDSEDAAKIRDAAEKLGFVINESGEIGTMSEEESIAESLAELPIDEQIQYYLDRSMQETRRKENYHFKDTWFFENNITLFGQDVRYITLEQVADIAYEHAWTDARPRVFRENEWLRGYINDINNMVGSELDEGSDEAGLGILQVMLGYYEGGYAKRNDTWRRYSTPAGTAVGIGDLALGDSLATALTKLEFPCVEQILPLVMQWTESEPDINQSAYFVYSPTKEQRDVLLPDEKENEHWSIRYRQSLTANGDGTYQDYILITASVGSKESIWSTLNLYFYGPEYELWYVHVFNHS